MNIIFYIKLNNLKGIHLSDVGWKDINFNEEHPLKIFLSDTTNCGIVISSNDSHLKNAPNPIDFTDDGIISFSNDMQ